MPGGIMRYIVSIVALIFAVNVNAECLLNRDLDRKDCYLSGFITSEPRLPDNQKVWICLNKKFTGDESNLTKFTFSGKVIAPTANSDGTSGTVTCNLASREAKAGQPPFSQTCGDFKIYTSVQAQPEKNPRQGYRVNAVVETSELRLVQKFYGQGKSECEIGFIEAQIVENKNENSPGLYPDCR